MQRMGGLNIHRYLCIRAVIFSSFIILYPTFTDGVVNIIFALILIVIEIKIPFYTFTLSQLKDLS